MNASLPQENINPKMGEYVETIHVNNRMCDVHIEVLRDGFQGYVIIDGMYFLTLPWASSKRALLDTASQRISRETP